MAIDGDGRQSENRNVDTQCLDEGAEAAHKPWQIPTLQQGSLELQREKCLCQKI